MRHSTHPELALRSLYEHYGFQQMPLSSPICDVFKLAIAGRHMADIVPRGATEEQLNAVRLDLTRAGYACRTRPANSPAILDEQLFVEFFGYESTRQRIRSDYRDFCNRLGIATGGRYEYRTAPYTTNGSSTTERDDLVARVQDIARSSGPRLVVIEAPAGFGKTCTAFEVANRLAKDDHRSLPLLAELSRNRGANIFRYILQDELSRFFPVVSQQLARYQIARGRLVPILDGFDELLYKPHAGRNVTFSDAETMLDTIRELLLDDACVLITTRKATLLSGEEFQGWLDRHSNAFTVHRFSIERPDPRTWLPGPRRTMAATSGLPLDHLASPVLFQFLGTLDDRRFSRLCDEPWTLTTQYLQALCEREATRQELRMSVAEQLQIFRSLALHMMTDNFKAERRPFFAELLRRQYEPLLSVVAERYADDTQQQRPDIEDIVQKLLLHALLDRRQDSRDLLGFQNDFVLGTLAGDNLLALPDAEWVGPEDFVDLMTTAFAIRSADERAGLWRQLQFMASFLPANLLIVLDIALRGEPQRPLDGLSFAGLRIVRTTLGDSYALRNCCFVGCSFVDVRFVLDGLADVTFIGCSFERCLVSGTRAGRVALFDSTSITDAVKTGFIGDDTAVTAVRTEVQTDDVLRSVLENFWPPGRAEFSRRRSLRTLYLGRRFGERDEVARAIRELRRRSLVSVDGDTAVLNIERLGDIAALLGRAR
jgi:hypothetical protein